MKARSIKLLIKEADRFLSDARAEDDSFLKEMYIKSTIAFAWFGLEGFVNLALSDFLEARSLTIQDEAFIKEQGVKFSDGIFVIEGQKFYPTRDKLLFLLRRFGNYRLGKDSALWNQLRNLENLRDFLVHPKENGTSASLKLKNAIDSVTAVKSAVSLVYKYVYKKTARF